jgi:hypothetical protein
MSVPGERMIAQALYTAAFTLARSIAIDACHESSQGLEGARPRAPEGPLHGDDPNRPALQSLGREGIQPTPMCRPRRRHKARGRSAG